MHVVERVKKLFKVGEVYLGCLIYSGKFFILSKSEMIMRCVVSKNNHHIVVNENYFLQNKYTIERKLQV